jgi:hypothetical protein
MVLLDPWGLRLKRRNKTDKKVFFKCTRYLTSKCPVSVTLDSASDMVTRCIGEHNHDSDIIKDKINNIVNEKILSAAQNPLMNPRTVTMEVSDAVIGDEETAGAIADVPNMKSIALRLHRRKKVLQGFPPLPKTWEAMEVPDSMKMTADGQRFLILEEQVREGKEGKIWGFSSPSAIQTMQQAKDLYIDGTFEFVETTLFKQILVIVARLANKDSVPVAFFFLPGKDTPCYKKVFECIRREGVTDTEHFHMDFEMGPIKAASAVFPQAKVQGCDVHWKRALRTNLSKHNLMASYNKEASVQQHIRQMWSLSMVHPDDVTRAWEMIKEQTPVLEYEGDDDDDDSMGEAEAADFNLHLEAFNAYFEQCWIGSMGRKGIRSRPRFDIKLWNKHHAVLEGLDLTNNLSEAWNSASKLSLSMKPSLWVLLTNLRKEEAMARVKMTASLAGTDVDRNRARTSKRAHKMDRLKHLVHNYSMVPLNEFINTIMTHFNG